MVQPLKGYEAAIKTQVLKEYLMARENVHSVTGSEKKWYIILKWSSGYLPVLLLFFKLCIYSLIYYVIHKNAGKKQDTRL